jgi:methylated-DNA-[protein]-cysteine S-methyltransferase
MPATEPGVVVVAEARITTPIGVLLAFARNDALCALCFTDGRDDPDRELRRRFGAFERVAGDPLDVGGRFAAYLSGNLAALDSLSVDPGGTPFQSKVWAKLRTIAAGTTLSYAQIADAVGSPEATRAVGAANGRNPIAIVVPCHRVVCSDGTLGGYGGGLERKRWLLDHEKGWAQRWLFR